MYKNIIFLALLAFGILFSCQSNDELETIETNSFEFSVITKDLTGIASRDSETACYTTPLIAGQFYNAGRVDVEVVNEDGIDYVYISYITSNDWILKLTHLYAGEKDGIPETRKGNAIPGLFEKKMDFETNYISDFEVEYKIEAAAFDSCFYIAAHAEVEKLDDKGIVIQAETAWGEGEGFDGSDWAMYFEFCKSLCGEPEDPPVDDGTK